MTWHHPPVSTYNWGLPFTAPLPHIKITSHRDAAVLLSRVAEECRRPACFPFGACRLHSWIAPQMSRRNRHGGVQPPPLDTQEPSVPGHYLLFLAPLQSTLISCSGVAARVWLEQRSCVTKGASKGRDDPWMHPLSCTECVSSNPAEDVFSSRLS